MIVGSSNIYISVNTLHKKLGKDSERRLKRTERGRKKTEKGRERRQRKRDTYRQLK